jgi:hypothetical protein
MKQILIDLEMFNLRFAQSQRQTAKTQLKWAFWECLIFGGVGLWFLISPLFGSSIWYMFTAAIYAVIVWFFIWKIRPRWISAIWRANRQIAEARIRLRKLDEE